MSITEIVLIIAGVIVMFLGYIMPAKKKDMDEDMQLISENEVRKLIDKELEGAKEHISDIIDETVTYSIEKTERSMERLTNEKIMAVNEYSDTVLEEINKNHKEVLFLYDMLNDKHENLKDVLSEAGKTTEEIKQTLKDAEITAKEAEKTAKEIVQTAKGLEETAKGIEETAKEAEETVKRRVDTGFDDGFVPIMPPRVEIIHDENGDYVAPEVFTEDNEPESIPKQVEIEIPFFGRKRRMDAGSEISEINQQTDTGIFGRQGKTGISPQRDRNDVWSQFVPVNDDLYDNGEADENPGYISQAKENENMRNSNDRILELHKAGKSNMAIAKELGLGIGEVKLVIDLFEGL